MSACTRVNGALLGNHVGKSVVLVGRVTNNMGYSAVIETPDKREVTVTLAHDLPPEMKVVEFWGSVLDANTVEEQGRVALTDTFDLNVYNEFVMLAGGAFTKPFY